MATFPPLLPSLVEVLFTLVLLQLIHWVESYFGNSEISMSDNTIVCIIFLLEVYLSRAISYP